MIVKTKVEDRDFTDIYIIYNNNTASVIEKMNIECVLR